ncbi:MAG TPA: tetratricopeptide repeat protein [Ktedonobacteraceae bacterium]|nr:tetratricopeptide repeat protein [Ktedonobacteraceae bacterium]
MATQSPAPLTCEVLILTALPIEYQAVLGHLQDIQEVTHPEGTVYEWGTFTGQHRVWRVVVAEIGMGGLKAASETERAIRFFQPQVAMFVGVAGGLKDVKLGDVVVSTRVYAYESGKATKKFEIRPVVWPSSYPLEERAKSVARKGEWLVRLDDTSTHSMPKPNAYVGTLAAGEKVLGSTQSSLFSFLKANYGDSLAVEMEGHGFLEAVRANHSVHGLVIRGISDLIDEKLATDAAGWQKRAAQHAAAFAFQVLMTLTLPSTDGTLSQASSAIWNVPYRRNPHFTGRDELLEQLDQQLSPEAQEDQTTTRRTALTQPNAIKGLGGIGKTQIAVEYTYRSRERKRYTHIIWINAASEEALLTSFAELAEQLPGFSAKGETDQRRLVSAIKRWLEQCQERWLLIFDNADDVALVDGYLPLGGRGSILLTTRAYAVGSLATSIEVETMGFVEGTQLLLRRAQRFENASDEEINQAGNIVVALDHFPLALDQAGAYIEETGCSFTDYLEIYQKHRNTLLARRGEQSAHYPASVATTWLLSFQKLQQANPAATELLQLCAFLAPDLIPEEFFREGVHYWPPLLQKAAAELHTFQQMIEALLKFSLVKRLSDDKMLSIHRLVQAVQMDMMEPAVQRQWAERVIQAVNTAFPENPQDIATWPHCRRYLNQAQMCNELIEQYEFPSQKAASLLDRTGIYLTDNGLYTLAEPLHLRALAIRQQVLGATHPDTVKSMNSLGSLYMQQTRYSQAEPLFLQALAVHLQQPGAMPLDTAQSFHHLACLYNEQGGYKDAEDMFQEALEIYEPVLGPEHPQTVANSIGLAWAYMKQENYSQAESPIRKALEIREQSLGPTHPTTADTLDALGWFCWHQGNYQDAELLYKRALDARKKTLEPNHPVIAQNLLFLALVYRDQGNYKEAEALCEQSLAIYKQGGALKSLDMGKGYGVYTLLLLKRRKLIKATRTGIQILRILGLKETFRYAKETLGVHEK